MLHRKKVLYVFCLLASLLGVALVNFVIDPFRVYGAPQIARVNKIKVSAHNYLHISKAHAVYQKLPDNLILGTSRAGVGLDPEHPGWGGGVTYNLGIPGGTMLEVLRYFEHFNRVHPVKKIVLGLDFSSFNAYKRPKEAFSEERLMTKPLIESRYTILYDLVPTLLSASAFNQSLYTLRRNVVINEESFARFMDNGQAEWTYLLREIPKNGGAAAAVKSVEYNYMHGVWFPAPQRKFAFHDQATGIDTLEYYRQVLRLAYENYMKADVVICPFHARLSEAMGAVGLWGQFETWKRRLVEINEEEARKFGVTPFVLWDFSGYNSIDNESVPPENEPNTLMKWFWDGTHFRPELGLVVLDKVFGYRAVDRAVPDDFGVTLNGGNIDKVLSDMRAAQHAYRTEHLAHYEFLLSEVRDSR